MAAQSPATLTGQVTSGYMQAYEREAVSTQPLVAFAAFYQDADDGAGSVGRKTSFTRAAVAIIP